MENFPGRVAFPETFIVNNSLLISFSRVTKRIRTRLGQSNIEVKKHFEERRKKSAKDIAKSLSMTGST